MKSIKYFILLSSLWHGASSAFSNKSFMTYRSQGFNLARNNSGWLDRCTEHNASITLEATRSFDTAAINNYFFGCNELIFSGSRVANRGANEILADYFGVPTDFKSSVQFCPKIRNTIADFDFYWLLGCEDSCFSLRVNVPVVRTVWDLNPCEKVINPGTFDYPAGYMSNAIIRAPQLQKGVLGALSGTETFGDLILPLQFGRIPLCQQSVTKFSDVLVALGYKVLCEPCGMLDVDVHVVVPTGTRSQAQYLFEPQVGNGHHWALGASLSARYDLVDHENWKVSTYLDAYVQHLFKTTQKRSYDLVGSGPGSRYMLLMDMIRSISNVQGFSPDFGQELLQQQYATRLLYVADATTLNSKIKIDVQADLVAKLSATYCQWSGEIGYNFWARSQEKLVCRDRLQYEFYGVKGDAQIYGFIILDASTAISIPLNATQSQATLYTPQGNGNTTQNFVNSNADNAALMYNATIPIAQTTPASLTNTGATMFEQVNGSNQAIDITDADIHECSGLSPRALSHKIFGAIRYECETTHTQPYFVLGAEGEFSGKTDCLKTAISQWGVWGKVGFNY